MKVVKNFKAVASFAAAACLAFGVLTGCSSSASSASVSASTSQSEPQQTLAGHSLQVYCGAGMTQPFTEIADAFTQATGCEMNVTYANAAQIQTQIKETQQGDFFIAGSAEEVKPVEEFVSNTTPLVKHIPVLVVPNNSSIAAFADLANVKVLLIGDPEATPIGKIAKNALTEAGLWEGLNSAGALVTTTTAPQIATALANSEGDAGIVWKENVSSNNVRIVECPEMQKLIKTIPSAMLSFSTDKEATQAFADFLNSETAKTIWTSYGYELVG